MPNEPTAEKEWYRFLTEGERIPRVGRHIFAYLPSSPRCKVCNSPFKSWGGFLMRWAAGREQSKFNPRYCVACERFEHPGGAEVPLSMLFADVRGSTALAEQMSALDFSRLINRFYTLATDVLVRSDALVDRLVGDEAVGLFFPGFAGPDHPHRAVLAARDLLKRTGHGDLDGPWLPVGIGVHTGIAYVGVVGGEEGYPKDFTALGDHVNVTARLASQAGPGEILISEATYAAAGLDLGDLERRELALKGKREPTGAWVWRINPG